ncbi:ATP-binding protein [Mongoliibacter ruber]|uniref:histidine kinase n=1 Tax=Mongoliibacter ruber TaxID=1750599 RepID=A0A2T0WK82_9BACT|nr:ATP-binding protein [Mongoliibacter ruber]PRY87123.1 PAS domain S-box-containing protein [Mongoliibacter ruber]
MKKSIFKIFYQSPILTGIVAFLLALFLTQFLTYKEVALYLSDEEQLTKEQANLIEKRIANGLSSAISAAHTLEFIERRYGPIDNFEEIGRDIIQNNPNIDVIELLKGGEIIEVYPLEGNRLAIGYDILEDPSRSAEAIRARDNREVFFAGPFELKQGGMGIIGRLPIFKNDEFWGFSAVIIYLETFQDIIGIDEEANDQFYIQLVKNNPESGEEEYFLPVNDDATYTGHIESEFIDWGNWTLTVQLKKSEAWENVYLALALRFLLSVILGLTAWYLATIPAMLEKKVNSQSRRLSISNERFKYATMATSDAIWDWDIKEDKVYRSKNFENLFGYKRSEMNNNNDFWDKHIHPDDLVQVNKNLKNAFESKSEYWEQEFRFLKRDGTYAHVVDKGIIIRDKEDQPVRVIGATQDISKIKASESEMLSLSEQLKNRARELELSNEELEKFAYTVSHDLQEPLRMISSFLKLLEKKYGENLDDKGKQYIQFASEGAIRMRQIILDLLEYSMAGNVGSREKVCIHEVLDDVKLLHRNVIQDKNATLTYEKLPLIVASKAPMRQLFLNIIDNALKYSKPNEKPEIKIEVKESPEYWHFQISDNGIGIEPQYHHQVFNIFQRLHTKEVFQGTGVGLAICKKIIETHGGKIWVESLPDLGTSIFFTLKKFEFVETPTTQT